MSDVLLGQLLGQLLGPLLGLVVCGVLGLLVPRLIALVPEPASEPSSEPSSETPPKELYATIGALPGLAWRSSLAAGLAGALIGHYIGVAWPLLFLVPLVPIGVALAIIDWRTMLLPTKVIAPSYVLVIVLVLVCWALTQDSDDLVRAGWGWLVGGGTFFLLWFVYPRGLGYGDVRLSGVLGIALGYLGWGELIGGLYAGFLLGGLGGGVLSVLKVVERKAFPFGPFMLVGALVGIAVGDLLLGSLVGT